MRTIVAAAACVAAVGAAPGAAASGAGAGERTENAVCSRAFGSVQDLPSVSYGNRFMAAVGRDDGFATGCYGDYPVGRLLRAQGLTGTVWTWVSSQSGFGYTYSTYCDSAGRTAEIAILLGDREPGGWHAVDGVRVENTAGALSGYADRLLAAWRRGDAAEMRALARPGAVTTLLGAHGSGAAWRQLAVRYDQRQTWVDYTDDAGAMVSLRVNQAAAIAGEPGAVVQALVG